MPKLGCPCGHVINLSIIPSPYGFEMIHEPKVGPFVAALSEAPIGVPAAKRERAIYDTELQRRWAIFQVYECERCLRLAVLRRASDADVAVWLMRDGQGSDARTSLAALVRKVPPPPEPSGSG